MNTTKNAQKRTVSLYIFVFLVISVKTIAQSYYFDSYGVKDGLAQSKVFTILQAKNDYVWLGTKDGVSIYDGVSFQNYKAENGLADNAVRLLTEDSKNRIWLGHEGGGITCFDGRKFNRIKLSNLKVGSDITSIVEDKHGRIWISTVGDGALLITNPFAPFDKLNAVQYTGSKLSDRVFKIYRTHNHSLYFITDVGIKWFNEEKNTFIHEKIPPYFQAITMIEDRRGDFWFGTYHGGLFKYNKLKQEINHYDAVKSGLSSNWVSTIQEDRAGNIWVGTWGGGITMITNDKMKVFNVNNGLNDNKIWCITEDKEGNILIGTTEHGFSVFKGEQFESYTTKDGLINQQVSAILQDHLKRYWFGTYDAGISVFDPSLPKGKQYLYFNQQKNNISNQIRFLKQDKNKNVWLGTNDLGVSMYDSKTGKFVYPVIVNMNMPNDQLVTAMEIDRENNLWVGSTDGIVYYEINNRKAERISQYNGLSGNDISAIFCDSKNTIWVGAKAKGISYIQHSTIKKFTLPYNFTPKVFCEDKKGQIWVGTEGNGILVFNDFRLIKQYTNQNGLLANLINSLVVDNDNNVYVGTNKGMNKILQKENRVYTYTAKNGFTGIEVKDNSSIIDASGKVWFGTVNGAISYNKKLDNHPMIEPLTHISNMKVNLVDHEMNSGLELKYNQNSIIFDYTSICLTNSDAVKYQVMLEGVDPTWQPLTNQVRINYSTLPPNTYTFKVRAQNSYGIWNSTPAIFTFRIRPPFYKTWWFILLSLIVVGLSVIFLIRFRERQLKKENRVLEEKVQDRTVEIANKNRQLAMKNKDITDSIQYAKRIQIAMLPPENLYPETFILYKPKDIVSGDFYWLMEHNNKELLAAVDCTGHGVPGAFMSIIGHNSLNKIVKEYNICQPSEILDKLNQEVTKTLHQSSERGYVNDGMDIALISYDKETSELQYSGAYNPLWLIRSNELIEIKANRFAIGRTTDAKKHFTNNQIKIQKGDTIYLFTDGYADQFGGTEGKKMKTTGLKSLLLSIQNETIQEQRNNLDKTIENWRGQTVQIDDILVIGRRF
jgi:ligand-binding sensor domain-containing protein/serine phosphatase RsbU (regulator of sigma subunit)